MTEKYINLLSIDPGNLSLVIRKTWLWIFFIGGVMPQAFDDIKVDGQIYHLSKYTTTHTQALADCSANGWLLAQFDTNDEYHDLREFLLTSNDLQPIHMYGNEFRGVYVDASPTDSNNDGSYEFSWKQEPLGGDVWVSGEPNLYCNSVSGDECCTFIYYYSSISGLRDTPGKCHSFSVNFLCKASPGNQAQQSSTHVPQAQQSSTHVPQAQQSSTHVPLAHQSSSHVPQAQQSSTHVPQAQQSSTHVPQAQQSSTHVPLAHQSSSHVPHAHTCEQISGNPANGYACNCYTGYRLNADQINCDDVDECSLNTDICSHNCTNTIGSYICYCPDGYTLDTDGVTCFISDPCSFWDLCEQNCTNNLNGRYTCTCISGYELDGRYNCRDVDECDEDPCGVNGHCHNKMGTFKCHCNSGYSRHNSVPCVDVDECAENMHDCNITDECHNTEGSYECVNITNCDNGYRFDDDLQSCIDVDECAETRSLCQQDCVNTNGSYLCVCGPDYELLADLRSCVQTNNNCSCADRTDVCSNNNVTSSATSGTIDEVVAKIEAELIVDKKSLSSFSRKLVCANDRRPSSQAVGCLGIVLLSTTLGIFIAFDLQGLLKAISKLRSSTLRDRSSMTSA